MFKTHYIHVLNYQGSKKILSYHKKIIYFNQKYMYLFLNRVETQTKYK